MQNIKKSILVELAFAGVNVHAKEEVECIVVFVVTGQGLNRLAASCDSFLVTYMSSYIDAEAMVYTARGTISKHS